MTQQALTSVRAEWEAIIARRRQFNASGQDGRDFKLWIKSRGINIEPHQLELF